jgi:hypothetical protein
MKSRLPLFALATLCLLFAGIASADTCPFNIPVVTLLPHSANGFSWGSVIRPQGDACVAHIAVESTNDTAWYVGGFNGLYMTKTNGLLWTKPLSGNVNVILLVPGVPQLVYVGIGNNLWLSRDHGANWNLIRTFNQSVMSLMVNGGTLYVGLGWNDHINPSGVWITNLGGGLPVFKPFGLGQTGLIVWTLSRDPISGAIYAGTEIFDHPSPYHPPFFRSLNNGNNWTNVAGTLPWHAIDSAVRPSDGYVYALLEGPGVYGSANQGMNWTPPQNAVGPSVSLLMDPNTTTRLFGGRQKAGLVNGGFFVSTDAGLNFIASGLQGVTVGGLAVNGSVSRIYAATYGSGIYTSVVP